MIISYGQELPLINHWLEQHGMHPVNDLPKIGFIYLSNDYPIAAAFLRNVEGNIGILEGLITNPEASSAERNDALDALVARIIAVAEHSGINLICWTTDASVLERSERHGFTALRHTLLSKGPQ